jgi:hypothetical protein
MKIKALDVAKAVVLIGEFIVDLARGKLEPKVRPLPHKDAERQSHFARCAGHEHEPRCKGGLN